MKTRLPLFVWFFLSVGFFAGGLPCQAEEAPPDWSTGSPRREIRPRFQYSAQDGPHQKGALRIEASDREELIGYWEKSFPVIGDRFYQFRVFKKTQDIDHPVRSTPVKIIWQDDQGNLVPGGVHRRRPDYPPDRATDAEGWTEVSDLYHAPPQASRAKVELRLQWAPGGSVDWSEPTLTEVPPPKPRNVRLAAVHYRPQGKTPADNPRQFAPLVAKAAQLKADLVCLGESITFLNTGKSMADVAEPVPGPSTEYLGELSKQHDLYLAAGLVEREGAAVFNTAVLLGPDGKLVGKYRKTCLPREEVAQGVTPGHEYPVFSTRFGKVALMVCWDVHFPEVARNLALRGAEVIALPIWGGNRVLARARAIENQVFVVTSTYSTREDQMKTGILEPTGRWLVQAQNFGDVVVAEVDLDKRHQWEFLGDFRRRIWRELPVGGYGD